MSKPRSDGMQVSIWVLGLALRVLYIWGAVLVSTVALFVLFTLAPKTLLAAVALLAVEVWFVWVSAVGYHQLVFTWNLFFLKGEPVVPSRRNE